MKLVINYTEMMCVTTNRNLINQHFLIYIRQISDEINNYTLQISLPIEGNASDADPYRGFHLNNGMPFSTVDKSSSQYNSDCANNDQYG